MIPDIEKNFFNTTKKSKMALFTIIYFCFIKTFSNMAEAKAKILFLK